MPISDPVLRVPTVSEETRRKVWDAWCRIHRISAVAETVGLDVDSCRRVVLACETALRETRISNGPDARTGRQFGGSRGRFWGRGTPGVEEDEYGDESGPDV